MVRHTQKKRSTKRTMKHGRKQSRRGGSSTTMSQATIDVDEESDNSIRLPGEDGDSDNKYSSSMGGKRRRKGGSSSSMLSSSGGRRRMRGGAGAADWMINNFGGGNEQWNNTFLQSSSAKAGNLLPTVAGAIAVGPNNIPQGSFANSSSISQAGGRRRKKKGGFMGMISKALVPLSLWGLQNRLTRRRK
jgi:hypothetical protein